VQTECLIEIFFFKSYIFVIHSFNYQKLVLNSKLASKTSRMFFMSIKIYFSKYLYGLSLTFKYPHIRYLLSCCVYTITANWWLQAIVRYLGCLGSKLFVGILICNASWTNQTIFEGGWGKCGLAGCQIKSGRCWTSCQNDFEDRLTCRIYIFLSFFQFRFVGFSLLHKVENKAGLIYYLRWYIYE